MARHYSTRDFFLGDKIAEGAVVLTLEVASAPAAAPAVVAAAPAVLEQKAATAPVHQAQAASS